ncbi:MAG: hypothetical protein CVV06_02535 [Gammaproteobacteria bacterium HGW-Gammaproteobacteria-10]|nr:MAG: hypothetical protein CVV06_02535 [Gammaproteobacteria bacterium HGW-Gammaproteobacteria-10]
MQLLKHKLEVNEDGWDHEIPTTYFSQPYGFIDCMEWVYNVLINPPVNYCCYKKSDFNNTNINQIIPQIRIGFIGDIMKLNGVEFIISENIKSFFSDTDLLIGNFEGTILRDSCKPVFMGQVHAESILEILSGFFPPSRTVLSCANNHSGDYGWTGFCSSYQLIQDYGFITIGRRDEPSIVIDGKVNIVSCTSWSNQKCNFVATIDEADRYFLDDAAFNILYPHWGYEMQLNPKLRQVQQGRELLSKWDMVIGHHSHCPQPIVLHENNLRQKLMAYSLGNFCNNKAIQGRQIGIILKVELGPDQSGAWAAGRVQWEFISISPLNDRSVELSISFRQGLPINGQFI